MILSMLVMIVGMSCAFGGIYGFVNASWNRQAGLMIAYIILVLVLTFATPMLSIHFYYR